MRPLCVCLAGRRERSSVVRKDAKIALCVILALMVLVVVIWGRSQRQPDVVPGGTQAEQARLPEAEDEPVPRITTRVPSPPPSTPRPAVAPPPADPTPAPRPTPRPAPPAPPADPPLPPTDNRTAMINHFGPLTDEERRELEEPEDDPTPIVVQPTDPPTQAPAPSRPRVAPAPQPGPRIKHTIAKGDTYQGLARRYYKNPAKWRIIFEANGVEPSRLAIGKTIVIPPLPEEKRTATVTRTPAPARPTAPARKTYTVKKGDNFYNIARSVYRDGAKWRTLYEANRTKLPKPNDPASLPVGMVIEVPKLASSR
jgi:LysM repeat protein